MLKQNVHASADDEGSDDSDSNSDEDYQVEVKERLGEEAEENEDLNEQMHKQKNRKFTENNNEKEKEKEMRKTVSRKWIKIMNLKKVLNRTQLNQMMKRQMDYMYGVVLSVILRMTGFLTLMIQMS